MLQVCIISLVQYIEEVLVLPQSAHFLSMLLLDCIALEEDLLNIAFLVKAIGGPHLLYALGKLHGLAS